MEILKNFGFDQTLLAAQIINFLIIFYLLKRFMYKPVLGMIKKRENVISEGLKQAEEARIKLEETIVEEKKILAKAQDTARQIVEDAKQSALSVSKEIEESTKLQTEKMIAEAKQQMTEESKNIEERLMTKVSVLASSMLSKSLEGIFSEKEQKQIVEKTLKQIKKAD